MPFNGSGSFSPYTPGNPAVTGTVISSTAYNATQQDIAAGLSNAVTRDGQSPLTANLPAAGRKLTGLGAGVVAGDSLRFEQLFSQGAEQDIASAATVDIGSLNTTIARITGTTTITSFGTNYNGPRYIRFAGALTLTHNASTLILPGNANITTAAGDRAILTPIGNPGSGWQVVAYVPAVGTYSATQSAQMAGMRNLLINGNFAINQRSYVSGVATVIANQYTLDRWRVVTSGQNLTFSASGNGNQITAPAGGVEQVIEGLSIAGGSYVLNWTGTATATVGGTARAKGEVFALTAGANVTVRFTGGTVSVVQLEPGTVATPFEARPYGLELSLCQRYYEVQSVPAGDALLYVDSATANRFAGSYSFAAQKRVTPTATVIGSPTYTNASTLLVLVGTDSSKHRVNTLAAGAYGIAGYSVSYSAEL